MAVDIHLEHWQDTEANVRTNGDLLQAGEVGTGTSAEWAWLDNDASDLHYYNRYINVAGGGTTYKDTIFNDVTANADMYIGEYEYHLGDTDTNRRYQADRITDTAGGVTMIDMVEGATDYVNILSGTIYADATNNRVGLLTATPGQECELQVDQNGITTFQVDNDTDGTAAGVAVTLSSSCILSSFALASSFTTSNQYIADCCMLEGDGNQNLIISNTGDIPISFWQNGAEVGRFDAGGNFGVGTDSPTNMIHAAHTSAAHIAIQNLTNENGQDEAESKLKFMDHADAALATIMGAHDGTGDDTKGVLVFETRDGSGSVEAMRIDSNGNVLLPTDGVAIIAGVDGEVSIQHVHDLGFAVNSDNYISFRDSALYINSHNDGHLDLTADTSIDLNAGITYVSGNLGVGIATPQNPAHIHTASSAGSLLQFTNDTTGSGAGSDGAQIGIDGDEKPFFFSAENTDMYLGTNNTVAVTLNTAGKIVASEDIFLYDGKKIQLGNAPDSESASIQYVAATELLIQTTESGDDLVVSIGATTGIIRLEPGDLGLSTGAKLVVIGDEEASIDFGIKFDGENSEFGIIHDEGVGELRFSGTIDGPSNYLSIGSNGDLGFAGTAGFYPRRISQSGEPANGTGATQIDVGELLIWRDSDNTDNWLVYNDTNNGVIKVQLS